MTVHVQQSLRNGTSLDQLRGTFAINSKRHREHPNLVLLKYNQIASPFQHQLVRECRGIILDEADSWRIVSRAFDKFFNMEEPSASSIDWSTARVQEKLDGSLCVLYAYRGIWHVATSGTPDASGSVHGGDIDFATYFWRTFDASVGDLPPADCGVCFYFELTGPLNRIVVVHDAPSVTLLGARDLDTQLEISAQEAARRFLPGVETVREYSMERPEDILASYEYLSPLKQEGYVVVDGGYNRIECKHPGYVALHHAKDGLTFKAFVDIARKGETSEVIAAFPEFQPMLASAMFRVSELVDTITEEYDRLSGIESQKDFAIQAVKTGVSSALFALRNKKADSAASFVANMRLDTLLELVGGPGEEPMMEAA